MALTQLQISAALTNSSSIVPAQKDAPPLDSQSAGFFGAFAALIVAQKIHHFVCRLAKRYTRGQTKERFI